MTKSDRYLVIYLDATKKNKIIVHPTDKFNGDWKGLAYAVSNSNDDYKRYHSYEVV